MKFKKLFLVVLTTLILILNSISLSNEKVLTKAQKAEMNKTLTEDEDSNSAPLPQVLSHLEDAEKESEVKYNNWIKENKIDC